MRLRVRRAWQSRALEPAHPRSGCAPSGMLRPELLGLSAIAVCSRPDVLNVDVAFVVKIAQEVLEAGERLPDVTRLLSLGIGLVGDLDIEVNALFALF